MNENLYKAIFEQYQQGDPEAIEYAGLAKGLLENALNASKKAKHLSNMIHSDDEGMHSINDYLKANPLNAHDLMALVYLERAKDESQLGRLYKAETAKINAKKRLENDERNQWKQNVVKPLYDAWQADPSLYSNKTAFARHCLDLKSCQLNNDDSATAERTITNWCREWGTPPAKTELELRQEVNSRTLELNRLIG